MSDTTYLGRWIRTRLYLRFKHAGLNNSYHFLLSTLISEGVVYPYKDLKDNVKQVKKILDSLNDILGKYEVELKTQVSKETKRNQTIDARFILYPNQEFIKEVIRLNVHHKALEEAVRDPEGKLIMKPFLDQYEKREDYQHDLRAFNIAKARNQIK